MEENTMNVFMTILYILLFIVCLSILIMIHELGHFTAAKIFKVYVMEYSIGFGPALIHKKRKNGETYFSLRIIPFGGYVSMFGEGAELPEGQVIEESRSIEGIRKWKRAIILVAGVTMNAVLAFNLFFVSNVAFSNTVCNIDQMTIAENSKAALAGLQTKDILATDFLIDKIEANYGGDSMLLIDNNATVSYTSLTTEQAFVYLDYSSLQNFKNLELNKFLVLYGSKMDGENKVVNYSNKIDLGANFASVLIDFKTISDVQVTEDKKTVYTLTSHPILVEKDSEGKLEDFGYKFYLNVTPPLSFGKAIVQSFKDFGNTSTLIVRALATLFTKDTWKSMGGIIAVGYQSTSVLQNFGWGKFIYLWGALSVNLAILNLVPFPGLDGWQLLVLAVEAIFRKKIPNKVKTIVSIVGIALLFAFMIALVVKDIITYII